MRRFRFSGLLIAVMASLLAPAIPVAADGGGLRVQQGAPDAIGCFGLDVWNGGQLIYTIPADDGAYAPDFINCAYNVSSVLLPNGNLVFDWVVFAQQLVSAAYVTNIWGSDGSPAGTNYLTGFGGETGAGDWGTVGPSVFVSRLDYRCQCSFLTATRGTITSTFDLPGGNPSRGRFNPAKLPLNTDVVVGARIVYAADSETQGRELYVSDGSPDGSFLLKDLRPGHRSSGIRRLRSDGTTATFTANDGHGRKKWVTDGTVDGTHLAH